MASVPWDVGCVVGITVCAVLCRVEAATIDESRDWCVGGVRRDGVAGGSGIVSVGAGAGVWWFVIADPGVELELKVESGMLCETAVTRPME